MTPPELAQAVVEDPAAGSFRVSRRVFVDPAVLEAEREAVFARCWLYLAHASELPAPGAFITREVAGRPLLVNRARDGTLQAFFNACSHRGAPVCREARGQRRAFRCPYHGWTYDDRGTLVHVPLADAMADHLLDGGALDLRAVPHLQAHRDFVFVHFDPAAVAPLRDYLGGAAEVLNLIADQSEHGLEVIPGAHHYSVPANWKLLLENSADGYHGAVTHSTYGDYLRARDGALPAAADGLAFDLGQGHSYTTSWGATPWGRPVARWVPGFGAAARPELEATLRGLVERLGEDRARTVALADRNLLIFPNLVVNDIMAITVRTFWPLRHDQMEVSAWGLAPRGQSDAARARTTRNFVEFLGPAGFATPDDVEMLALCQQGYRATGGDGFNDLSRGMRRSAPLQTDEAQMRAFWRQWQHMVAAVRPAAPPAGTGTAAHGAEIRP